MNVEELRQGLAEAARRTEIDAVNALAEVRTRTRRRRRQRRLTSAVAVTSALLTVALLVALVASGLSGGNGRPGIIVPASSPTSTSQRPTVLALIGSWQPQRITGYGGRLVGSLGSESPPLISFSSNGTWSGSDGCNRLQGTYEMKSAAAVRLGRRWSAPFHATAGPQTTIACASVPNSDVMTKAVRVDVFDRTLTFFGNDQRELGRYVQTSSRPHAAVSARVELSFLTVAAGSSTSGRVVVENNSGHALHLTGCERIFQVLLRSDQIPQIPGWLLCRQKFTIPVGESSYPVTVDASYVGCSAQGPPPQCVNGGLPPLPPGVYEATVFENGNVVPIPPPITVRVGPAHRVP